MLVTEGMTLILQQAFRGNDVPIAPDANYYVGLCSETPNIAHTLANILTEPSAAGGYARQPVARNSTGYPTIAVINNSVYVKTLPVAFSAVGVDFSTSFTRLFLATSLDASGILIGYSAPLTEPRLILAGETFNAEFASYHKLQDQ